METVRRIPKGGWVLCLLVCVACTAGLTFADWDPGDDYKMHFPQLPNLTGWDVFAEYAEFLNLPRGLADDWQCTESGPVTDIHFWGSWWQDVKGDIGNIGVGIFADNGDQPGDLLWGRVFTKDDYTVREYATGDQGWFNPYTGNWILNDHEKVYQYNIPVIPDPFLQEEGQTYWLAISADFEGCMWGWKTSQDHFGDGAVFWRPVLKEWDYLYDPQTGEALDLAFVITPEPATIALLGLGALALLRKRSA